MKKFSVSVGDRKFVVKAETEAKAVKKLKDAQARKVNDAHTRVNVGCAEITINNEAKAYSVGSVTYINGRDERTFRDYAKQCIDVANKLKELNSKGYKDDVMRAYDSAIRDGNFYGISGMEFIWNGTQSDPFIKYRGRVVNYYDVENALWADYQEECKEEHKTPKESEFEKWVKQNASMAKYYAENAPQVKFKDSAIKDSDDYSYEVIKEQIGNEAFSKDLLLKKAYNGLTRGSMNKEEYNKLVEEIKTLRDASVRDGRQVDPERIASYAWTIERELLPACYWEAVDELAYKLNTEQDYIREIPKLAKQKFENYIKQVNAEYNKIVAAARAKLSDFDKQAPEQAKAIMKKQENK